MKDNVALIVVLEALEQPAGAYTRPLFS